MCKGTGRFIRLSLHLSPITLPSPVCHAQPLVSSLSAGNLIKVTSRLLPCSPYAGDCPCLSFGWESYTCLKLTNVPRLKLPSLLILYFLKIKKAAISPLHSHLVLWFSLTLSSSLFRAECVSVYPWLPAPLGSISRLHLFEGFLIWGLGQPQSNVPSSIITAEERRGGGEEG